MSLESAKKYIDKALEIRTISTVGFSGGEALLHFDEVCELSLYAKAKGIKIVSLNTNGFWGKSFDDAVKVLSILSASGISKIGLSSDDYHQEFVPASNVKNILDAATMFNISIDLGVMISNDSRRLHEILPQFGDNITGNLQKLSFLITSKKIFTNKQRESEIMQNLYDFRNKISNIHVYHGKIYHFLPQKGRLTPLCENRFFCGHQKNRPLDVVGKIHPANFTLCPRYTDCPD